MPKKYKEGIYMGVAPTTHMHATNVTLNNGTSVQADSDAIHDYLNRKFELIEDITLTEDTAIIERTTEPDTTPYNFESVLIFFTTAAGAGDGVIRLAYNNNAITQMSGVISVAVKIGTFETINTNGIALTRGYYGNYDILQTLRYFGIPVIDTNINKITLTATTAGIPRPTGSNFKIYAVRAQEV